MSPPKGSQEAYTAGAGCSTGTYSREEQGRVLPTKQEQGRVLIASLLLLSGAQEETHRLVVSSRVVSRCHRLVVSSRVEDHNEAKTPQPCS